MKKDRGFIETVILIIVGLVLLKYFLNWDIFDRDIFNAVWSYIGYPVTWAWDNVAWPILRLGWGSFQEFIEWGRDNAATGI